MKNEIQEPEIITYEAQALTLETTFTVVNSNDSSRLVKTNFGTVNAREVLERILET